MSLDSPERVKYFGLQNVSCCATCRRRKGRSAHRIVTRHCPTHIENLYEQAHGPIQSGPRKRAREQLERHGLDWEKRCRLEQHAKVCLVRVDKYGPTLFAGLCKWERMHIYFIGYCSYAMELFIGCVDKSYYGFVHRAVLACQQFRDPVTGVTHPRLPYLLKMTHLTAERRVRAIFYWAHVVGLKAEVIEEPVRVHVQLAIAYLQLILIATRGHRAYTAEELHAIFHDIGRQFFMQLEQIADYLFEKKRAKKQAKHDKNPAKHPAPKPHEAPARSKRVINHSNFVYVQ